MSIIFNYEEINRNLNKTNIKPKTNFVDRLNLLKIMMKSGVIHPQMWLIYEDDVVEKLEKLKK